MNYGNRKMVKPTIIEGLDAMKDLIENDINAGKIARQPKIQIPADQIENALIKSLVQA
jgi:hypothetical protein